MNEHQLTALQSSERYRRDRRFQMIAQSTVAYVMQQHGGVNPERADREASDIATRVCAMLLERIYREDPEIAALVIERDHYKKFAEETAGLRPMPPMIFRDVEVLHIDGDATNNEMSNLQLRKSK